VAQVTIGDAPDGTSTAEGLDPQFVQTATGSPGLDRRLHEDRCRFPLMTLFTPTYGLPFGLQPADKTLDQHRCRRPFGL
jgi:hypothetical protein